MNLRELRKKHANLIEKIKSMNALCEKEDRDFSADENEKLDAYHAEAKDLKSKIEKRERIKELELEKADLDIPQKEKRDYSFTNVLKALTGKKKLDGYEKEIMQELEKRGMKTQSPNGILVPTSEFFKIKRKPEQRIVDNQSALISDPIKPSEYVDALYEESLMSQLGIRKISATGAFNFPRSSGVTSGWFSGDGGSDAGDDISESDPTFESVSVSPKFLGTLSGWTLKQIMNMAGDLSLESLLREDMMMSMAEALDKALITADGTGNAPKGIVSLLEGLNPSRETDLDLSAEDAKWTWGNLTTEIKNLSEQYKNNEKNPQWLTNPNVRKEWMDTERFSGADGKSLYDALVSMGMMPVVSNYLKAKAAVNTSEVILGQWNELLVTIFGAMDLSLGMIGDDFKKGVQRIRAILAADFSLRRAEGFRKITIDRTM